MNDDASVQSLAPTDLTHRSVYETLAGFAWCRSGSQRQALLSEDLTAVAYAVVGKRMGFQWPARCLNLAIPQWEHCVLDRLLHHAQTVSIEGRSFRTKDQIEV